MAKKKATPKKATKKSQAAPKEEAQPEASVVIARSLAKGTVVHLPGDNTPITLGADTVVSYPDVANDAKFAGMLHKDRANFDLNIGQLEGVWNPVTARREE